jgi:serine/threonine protein kinase
VLVALDEHGNPKKVKLCDLYACPLPNHGFHGPPLTNSGAWIENSGVSKLLEGTEVARTMVGTPGWIAPEVLKNSQSGYTDKADGTAPAPRHPTCFFLLVVV